MRTVLAMVVLVAACGDDGGSAQVDANGGGDPTDITDAVFSNRDPDCATYAGEYEATVTDLDRQRTMVSTLTIAAGNSGCTVTSNGIPNHDFNDVAAFATEVSEVSSTFDLPVPSTASSTTALSLMYDNGVFLNGVKLDVLAAACYGVGTEPLGEEKIGCMQEGTPWRYDPMYSGNNFGTDGHNAHTQPNGAYHYHGDPAAMYADGSAESGLIGFAADGYPIYGPYIDDNGTIRKVESGYTLKSGARVSQSGQGAFPGGDYDGTFVDDYEFTDAGDLDECNGMMRDGSYGYYVTDEYPWVVGCFKGTPDSSFQKTP